MGHVSDGATALLGLDGFVVLAHVEVDGEVWIKVETAAAVVGCDGAGPGRSVMAGDGSVAERVRVRGLRCRFFLFAGVTPPGFAP